jgi:methylmalonyl-CoA mutase N-terminal domain/subunit
MSSLRQVVDAVEAYRQRGLEKVRRARADLEYGEKLVKKWRAAQDATELVTTPTGLRLPRLALPDIDEAGEVARFLWDEGLPGEFPFVTAAYPEQYLDRSQSGVQHKAQSANGDKTWDEEPTRLFAGFGLAEDTNARFHYLSRNQRSKRLSTAFDGPTLYGVGAGEDGVFGKIGEGGVAIDTVEDMGRLYDGFALDQLNVSVSMTISGPAPIILAMYVAAAKHRFGEGVLHNCDVAIPLRGVAFPIRS